MDRKVNTSEYHLEIGPNEYGTVPKIIGHEKNRKVYIFCRNHEKWTSQFLTFLSRLCDSCDGDLYKTETEAAKVPGGQPLFPMRNAMCWILLKTFYKTHKKTLIPGKKKKRLQIEIFTASVPTFQHITVAPFTEPVLMHKSQVLLSELPSHDILHIKQIR